jgi:hypothetical protein
MSYGGSMRAAPMEGELMIVNFRYTDAKLLNYKAEQTVRCNCVSEWEVAPRLAGLD